MYFIYRLYIYEEFNCLFYEISLQGRLSPLFKIYVNI